VEVFLAKSPIKEVAGMSTIKHVVGLVGSYRKGGYVDSTVNEVLSAARSRGAETEKIFLLDQHIEFCTNCRTCMQEPGQERGKCILEDGMDNILKKIAAADSIVIGAPVNCWDVNALTRKFYERCVGFAYWPWGALAPEIRNTKRTKKAVLISSSAAPGWYSRIFTNAMKSAVVEENKTQSENPGRETSDLTAPVMTCRIPAVTKL
jgi:multimeric flavodoxin WrbA